MMTEIEQFLHKTEFFRNLSGDEITTISSFFHKAEYSSGMVILHENEPADRFFMVAAGRVEVWKNYGGKSAALLANQTEGSIFGEMSLVDDEPRSATVVAETDCAVLHMSKDDFYSLAESYPSIVFVVLRALSRVIRRSNDSFIESLNKQNVELQDALDNLRSTQKELIRSERFSNLGKLSSLIIHDLRNPLSVIKGYAEMLQVLCDEPQQVREHARKIVSESQRLNRFAQELLDYSRGEIRLNWVFTSFPMIFQKLQQYLGKQLENSSIQIALDYDYAQPFYVDEERILRAILNLCDNGRKAMSDGGTLKIAGTMKNARLCFSVSDSGEGMSEDILSHIFEPFYSSSHRGGTGLGMISVKTIVEAHGGFVRIDSAIGKGTNVTLDMPCTEELPD